MTPQLNINELYSLQKKKKELRKVAFDKVIELIHKRIKNVSGYGGLNTFYEVPGILVGYPLYDIVECTSYIVSALRKNGFLVQILPPPHFCVFYVSWDPVDLKSDPRSKSAPPKSKHKAIDTSDNGIKQRLLRLF